MVEGERAVANLGECIGGWGLCPQRSQPRAQAGK